MTGVYLIINTENLKCYVGASRDIYHRWYTHLGRLRCNGHSNPHLQHSFNAHGEESFRCYVLERVSDADILFDLEEQYIFDIEPDYNIFYWGQEDTVRCYAYEVNSDSWLEDTLEFADALDDRGSMNGIGATSLEDLGKPIHIECQYCGLSIDDNVVCPECGRVK